jgi:hypothetical protein
LKEADQLDPLLKYSTAEIRERLVDKYRISEYAVMVRNTIHETTKMVSTDLLINRVLPLLITFIYIYIYIYSNCTSSFRTKILDV